MPGPAEGPKPGTPRPAVRFGGAPGPPSIEGVCSGAPLALGIFEFVLRPPMSLFLSLDEAKELPLLILLLQDEAPEAFEDDERDLLGACPFLAEVEESSDEDPGDAERRMGLTDQGSWGFRDSIGACGSAMANSCPQLTTLGSVAGKWCRSWAVFCWLTRTLR